MAWFPHPPAKPHHATPKYELVAEREGRHQVSQREEQHEAEMHVLQPNASRTPSRSNAVCLATTHKMRACPDLATSENVLASHQQWERKAQHELCGKLNNDNEELAYPIRQSHIRQHHTSNFLSSLTPQLS
jgi:hypothetical protein